MKVIEIITLMLSAVSCIFIVYAVGLYDCYKRDLRNVSKYLDKFVEQLGERHESETEMISALRAIASTLEIKK